MQTIEKILSSRSARLKGTAGDPGEALARRDLTMLIEHHYPAFEVVRDALMEAAPLAGRSVSSFLRNKASADDDVGMLFDAMLHHNLIQRTHDQFGLPDLSARRFVTGGWLEELAWLAAVDAGADEAYYSQLIGWEVNGYNGENEIDVIFRHDDRLGFVSCKALRSTLSARDRKHRSRMMDAVHEADNLADHFGRPGERVAVLVTTDLFDDRNGAPRYEALMGKAAVLDVRIVPLEDMDWNKLTTVMRNLMEA